MESFLGQKDKKKEWQGPVYLTVEDLSQMLQVSKIWVYKLVREKRIPFFHVEKCVRFSPAEIQEWLEERRGREWKRDKA